MDRGVPPRRNRCLEFVTKVYEMVDDPSTDSIISWGPNGDSFIVSNPLECCRKLLPQYLGLRNFIRFQYYGFEMVESRQLEFSCDDFVKDRPELLEKIGKRHQDRLSENYNNKRSEARSKRLRSCKTDKEWELVLKEYRTKSEMEMRAKMDQFLSKEVERFMQTTVAYEREWRREAFPKHLEDRLQLVLDSLNDLTSSSSSTL